MTTFPPNRIRNVAIIAHVDHGKTSLVDKLLFQSGQFRSGELEKLQGGQHGLIMDSNPLERERGITIFSKNCAVQYVAHNATEPTLINIIDTPGHADFGGEVERVLRMADGCLLVVDAFDGPMPQTRFVLGKALAAGLRPVVVVNKCDRPGARPAAVHNEVFDLMVELGAEELAMDFPIVYGSAREGWAYNSADEAMEAAAGRKKGGDLRPIFEAIVKQVPPPQDDPNKPLQMLVTTLDYSEYVGRIGVGRVYSGMIKTGQQVASIRRDGKIVTSRIGKLYRFQGLGKIETNEVHAGDLCAVVGLESCDIGDTICHPDSPMALPPVTVDEPTITMVFRVNDSPFGGQDGDKVTSRQIRDRLEREAETNVALKVAPGKSGEELAVSGRGLLHLGILIETMRREGFELSVGKPEVIVKMIDGVLHEPVEQLVVDVPPHAVGSVMELVGSRRGELKNMDTRSDTLTHLSFEIPAKGLLGLRSKILTATQGEGIMHSSFLKFAPASGETPHRLQGVLIATEGGDVTTYACEQVAERGVLFVIPGDKVYAGMVVGEHNRDNDLPVHITRLKQLTNFRVASKEATVVLKGARRLSLEAALEYIEDDELVEITPKTVRLRKRILDEGMRKRAERQSRDKEAAMAGG
ncbi:MAG: translational GTPase TypA [Phycisphaerales bacterium]|jgi:GTP-binding protein|nr:translational GTPase TypA [Phycisphaerales bacterium]